MVGTNVKAETLTLSEKRSEIEAEMNLIIARLCAPGARAPGFTGNLVDAQGFPRSDIDISAVRADRQRLAILRNDHKDITKQIDRNIEILHSGHVALTLPQKRTAEGEAVAQLRTLSVSRAEPSNLPSSMPNLALLGGTAVRGDSQYGLPFAVFDELQQGSPAALDGIMLGDQLIKFGNVESGDNMLVQLAREGRMNEGNAIPVIVLRRGEQVQLTVTPRQWAGPGLLGCHIKRL